MYRRQSGSIGPYPISVDGQPTQPVRQHPEAPGASCSCWPPVQRGDAHARRQRVPLRQLQILACSAFAYSGFTPLIPHAARSIKLAATSCRTARKQSAAHGILGHETRQERSRRCNGNTRNLGDLHRDIGDA